VTQATQLFLIDARKVNRSLIHFDGEISLDFS